MQLTPAAVRVDKNVASLSSLILFINVVSYESLFIQEMNFHSTAHPAKISANGRRTLTLPLVVFLDETSRNRSKKWNKLETYSFFLPSLPREEITKFSNINIVCVSNLVDSEMLGKVIAEDVLGITTIVM